MRQTKHASRVKHKRPQDTQEKAIIQFSPELRADCKELAEALDMGFGWKLGYSRMSLKILAEDLASDRPRKVTGTLLTDIWTKAFETHHALYAFETEIERSRGRRENSPRPGPKACTR